MSRSRNRKSAGFTLAETLVAVLIVSLVTIVVAGGITVLRDTYQKITLKANGETAVSTTLTAVGDTLRFARPLPGSAESEKAENPSFIDSVSGMEAKFVNTEASGGDDGNIAMQYGAEDGSAAARSGEKGTARSGADDVQKIPVVSEAAVTDQFYTKIRYQYDAGTNCYQVTVSAVSRRDGGGKKAGETVAAHTVSFRRLNRGTSDSDSVNG